MAADERHMTLRHTRRNNSMARHMTERKQRRKIRGTVKPSEQPTLEVNDVISVQNNPVKRVFTEQITTKNFNQTYENHALESTFD